MFSRIMSRGMLVTIRAFVALTLLAGISSLGAAFAAPSSRTAGNRQPAPTAGARVGAAESSADEDLGGIAAGLETLGDPEDRDLPEVHEVLAFTPGGSGEPARASRATEGSARLRAILGDGWTITGAASARGILVLRGPAASLDEAPSPTAVRHLLARLPEIFGDAGEEGRLRVVYDRSRAPSGTIRMEQVVEDAGVEGADVRAHFDPDGRLRSLSSTYESGLRPVNRRRLSAAEASAIAERALLEKVPGADVASGPLAERWITRAQAGPVHVWKVRRATRQPIGSWVVTVDAMSGTVLSLRNVAETLIKSGTGNVYPTNADYPNGFKSAKLPNLFGGADNPEGFLSGTRVAIFDNGDVSVASPTLKFPFDPFVDGDDFDQVNAYYHFQKAQARFAKSLKVRNVPFFDTGAAVPAIVNIPDFCNAAYIPIAAQGGPAFVFGNQLSCGGFQNEDFAVDSDVVYHEYTHGVVDWLGTGLSDAPLNSYQRAISEAIADYHAANFTGDPNIGEVLGVGRNIENHRLYPDDVGCAGGQMEEHCTGEIWSGILWDVQSVVKKKAELLAFASLDFLADDPIFGHVTGVLDFWDATIALLNADVDLNRGKAGGIVYGAAASRGIFGPDPFGSDRVSFIFYNFTQSGKLKTVGWDHVPGQSIPYFFSAPAGSTVSVTVRSTGAFAPTFVLAEGDDTFTVFAGPDTTSATQASVRTILPATAGLYLLEVSGQNAATGSFQVLITIKV